MTHPKTHGRLMAELELEPGILSMRCSSRSTLIPLTPPHLTHPLLLFREHAPKHMNNGPNVISVWEATKERKVKTFARSVLHICGAGGSGEGWKDD